ncbi:hypothetical protein [Cohnella yongneupensis]|uniref:Uncharacterized protein n=1 Tax=Cohnella yongneupensis TaxID=425006 RepID=A0ABW0QX80_9BACL
MAGEADGALEGEPDGELDGELDGVADDALDGVADGEPEDASEDVHPLNTVSIIVAGNSNLTNLFLIWMSSPIVLYTGGIPSM